MQSQSGTRERFTFMTPIGSGDDNRAGVFPRLLWPAQDTIRCGRVLLPFFHGPITPYVQVNDTHLHGQVERLMNMQGTDVEFKNYRDSPEEEPKAKAPKVNHDKSSLSLRTQVRAKDPPIHEVSRESQQINSDVDKFLFTLSMSCEELD